MPSLIDKKCNEKIDKVLIKDSIPDIIDIVLMDNLNTNIELPTTLAGKRDYLLGKPAAWALVTVKNKEYKIPLYE